MGKYNRDMFYNFESYVMDEMTEESQEMRNAKN